MSTIVTTAFEVFNAFNFVRRFREAGENLYVAIGKEAAWPDDLNPPVPLKTQEEVENFWDGMVGMQKVQIVDLELMVPRINWVEAMTTLVVFDKTNVNAYSEDFYIVNSQMNVYKVTTAPAPGTPTGAIEPTGTLATEVLTGDGYGFTYMFTVSLQDVEYRVNKDWIPVPILAEIPLGGTQELNGDVDAFKTLGAKFAFVKIKLDDSATVDGLPDITYRQVAIIANPEITDGITPVPATATHYTVSAMPVGFTFVNYSGQLLHLENRPPIIRIAGQFEETNLLFDF